MPWVSLLCKGLLLSMFGVLGGLDSKGFICWARGLRNVPFLILLHLKPASSKYKPYLLKALKSMHTNCCVIWILTVDISIPAWP